MKRLCWLLLVSLAFSQTQGNRPDVAESYQSDTEGSTFGQVVYPEPIAVGDELVVCINLDTGQPTPTVTDSLGNTWTMTSPTTTPAPQVTRDIYMAYTNSAFSGSDTISYSISHGINETMSVGRWKNLSGVLDGSIVTTTYTGNGLGGPGSFNTSKTTTVNGSVLISCAGNSGFGQSWLANSNNTEYVSMNGEVTGARTFLSQLRTNALGAYTPTFNTYNDVGFGSHATFAAQTIAFKPTPSIAIVDTALPEAATSVAYSAQLHCIGGTAGQTYSIFSGSLPTGLSLNTATGAITGTPSGTTQTVGFRCTDGTVTSATNSLTLTVQTGFNTVSVRQSKALSGDGTGNGSFASPVLCGSIIAVFYHGSDTHGGNGWLQPAAGSLNYVTDTLGTVFHRVGPIGGTLAAALYMFVGQTTSPGADQVTIVHPGMGGSGLNYTMAEISGAQNVVDEGAFSTAGSQSSSPITLTDSLTTVVPNEMLFAATSSGFNNSDSITLSPLAVQVTSNSGICCFDTSVLGWTSIGSASSYTATSTITTGGPTSAWPTTILQAFRPAATLTSCGVFTGAGEREMHVPW